MYRGVLSLNKIGFYRMELSSIAPKVFNDSKVNILFSTYSIKEETNVHAAF